MFQNDKFFLYESYIWEYYTVGIHVSLFLFYFVGIYSDAGGRETFARQREKSASSDWDPALISIVTDQQLSAYALGNVIDWRRR